MIQKNELLSICFETREINGESVVLPKSQEGGRIRWKCDFGSMWKSKMAFGKLWCLKAACTKHASILKVHPHALPLTLFFSFPFFSWSAKGDVSSNPQLTFTYDMSNIIGPSLCFFKMWHFFIIIIIIIIFHTQIFLYK